MHPIRLSHSIGAALLAIAACAFFLSPRTVSAAPGDAQLCANQTASLADRRIAACTKVLNSGKLSGKSKGVAYALRGAAYLDRGDVVHAIGDLNRAVKLAPDLAAAYQDRGNAWYARGHYRAALADYDAAIKLDPHSPSAYVNRGMVRSRLADNADALRDFDKAIDLSPTHAPALKSRGELYLHQHRYARARADFDRAIKLAPTLDTYMLRAKARVERGDLDGALSDYRSAERFAPGNVMIAIDQGKVWRKKGDLAKAIAAYDRALAIDPKNADALRARTAARGALKRATEKAQSAKAKQAAAKNIVPLPDHRTAAVPLPPPRKQLKSKAAPPKAEAAVHRKHRVQAAVAPPAKRRPHPHHMARSHSRATHWQDAATVWIDEYGRPLSPSRIRKIKRLLRDE